MGHFAFVFAFFRIGEAESEFLERGAGLAVGAEIDGESGRLNRPSSRCRTRSC